MSLLWSPTSHSMSPSDGPSQEPSIIPVPSSHPSSEPSLSARPSHALSSMPSLRLAPSWQHSLKPSLSIQRHSELPLELSLSMSPSGQPSLNPSVSIQPSSAPSSEPTSAAVPSFQPCGVGCDNKQHRQLRSRLFPKRKLFWTWGSGSRWWNQKCTKCEYAYKIKGPFENVCIKNFPPRRHETALVCSIANSQIQCKACSTDYDNHMCVRVMIQEGS